MALVKRLEKGSPLTFAEGDANLDYLYSLATNTGSASVTGSSNVSGSLGVVGPVTVTGSLNLTGSVQITGSLSFQNSTGSVMYLPYVSGSFTTSSLSNLTGSGAPFLYVVNGELWFYNGSLFVKLYP
jgi:hypothetical protein